MSDLFSPIGRRIIAVGLLILAILIAVVFIVLPLFSAIRIQLGELDEARFQKARLEAVDARPALRQGATVPNMLVMRARNQADAVQSLTRIVRTAAQTHDLTLEMLSPVASEPTTPMIAALDMTVTASETDVTAFINDLEQGEPPVRLVRWKLVPIEGQKGQVRLEARGAALWLQ
jgi:hypothetical protein